jgi:hypothetical protein
MRGAEQEDAFAVVDSTLPLDIDTIVVCIKE